MGIKRRLINLNTWFYILILVGILFMLWVTFSLPNANGITRAEYDTLENSLEQYQTQLEDIETTITNKRTIISDQEKKVESMKDILRDLKRDSDGTWEKQLEIIEYENDFANEEQVLKNEKANLLSLLDQKSEYLIQIKNLEEELQYAEIDAPPSLDHFEKKIGIVLSKTCLTMIQNNIDSTCPTYKDLITLDSSDTNVSGKFTTDENGFFHRSEPTIQNSWRLYDFDEEIRVFVDPPQGMTERIKTITLHPNFDTYLLTEDLSEGDYASESIFARVIYHDRYIDKCQQATINADKWELLLADTVHFMRNQCDRDHTSFQEREIVNATKTEIDITSSPNWEYQQWLEEVSNFCIFKFKQC